MRYRFADQSERLPQVSENWRQEKAEHEEHEEGTKSTKKAYKA